MTPISPVLRDNIEVLAKAYAKAKGIKLTTVSRLVRGDPHFLADFIKGNISVTAKKYDEIVQWFEDNWIVGKHKPKIAEFHPKPKTWD